MSQLTAGIALFLIPGLIPAYVRHKSGEKGSRLSMAVNALTNAFLILICTYGCMYGLFGDAVFGLIPVEEADSFYNHYILLYVLFFVTAYGCALLMSLPVVWKGSGQGLPGGKCAVLLMATVLWVILLMAVEYDDYAGTHLVINEVCSHNLSLILDDHGDSSDYIEIYNSSLTTVSLEGWYLTAHEDVLTSKPLQGIYIEPRSYLIFFANGDVASGSNEEGKTGQYQDLDFKLDEMGETLILADPDGRVVDRVEVPELTADVSYARLEDGQDNWSIVKWGTPGQTNEGLSPYVIPTLETPVFSAESGFYDASFILSLEAGEGQKIYYTLDGSEPTQESSLYTEPITIGDNSSAENYYANIEGTAPDGDYQPAYLLDKGTVVKAICVNEQEEVSEVVSRIYFVGFDEKSGYDQVNILSITCDPEDFFSADRGIYVLGDVYRQWELYEENLGYSFAANYTHTDRTGERVVTAALFNTAKELVAEEEIGVRIRGGASKNLRQKGFNFYAREEYGEDVLGLGSKMLRTSGSIDTNKTMLRDVFNQSLAADRDLETQPGEPCVLFLNGEYWGLYNLQTRFTEEYFEEKYGITEDNLIMVKQDKRVSIGEEEDLSLYTELVSYAQQQDLSLEENYEEISRMMDVQSFIDHYCFEIYIGNTDWPLNNICCWRSRETDAASEYTDGRWRWGIYDTDESTGIYSQGMGSYSSNAFLEEAHWFGSPMTTPLMSNLLENAEFKKQFVLSFMDMANENFEYGSVHEKLYQLASVYGEPMVETYHRFNGDEYTLDTFYAQIEAIDEFYRCRGEYIVPYMAEAMELEGSLETVTLQATTGGGILLNTIAPDLSAGEWSGSYYTDYPVTVTAVAEEGYRFVGWQGSCQDSRETIEAEVREGGIVLKAVFEPVGGD
ncbi:MAG: CotH kinase family protein [Clostridiales bacterium]|nr:CotH kinase family protein [Clostridiales bacterium]